MRSRIEAMGWIESHGLRKPTRLVAENLSSAVNLLQCSRIDFQWFNTMFRANGSTVDTQPSVLPAT
jgi:hypothetical protein